MYTWSIYVSPKPPKRVAQKFHFAILRIEVTRASRGLSAIAELLVVRPTARSELRMVLVLALSVTFFFVYKISREPLNEFAPNSHGIHVWFLARTSLKLKVKSQRSRSPGTKNGIFRPCRLAACGLCLVKHLQPPVSSISIICTHATVC